MFEGIGQRPVLLWSAGLDSTLLLMLLKEANISFDIVQIRDFWTKAQLKKADKLITEWNLKIFSYPPANVSFIGKGSEISTVWEYADKGARIPLIRDVIDGDRCIADLDGMRAYYPPMDWDTYIVGSRQEDAHYAMESPVPAREWMVGESQFIAPLFDKGRDWVKEQLIIRGMDATDATEEEDTGNWAGCSLCLRPTSTGTVRCPKENREIPVIHWSPELNLKLFQDAYGSGSPRA